jgi:hypothetical protein
VPPPETDHVTGIVLPLMSCAKNGIVTPKATADGFGNTVKLAMFAPTGKLVKLSWVLIDTPGASESVTWAVKTEVPVVVGVPLMRPVPAFNESPGGSPFSLMIDHL